MAAFGRLGNLLKIGVYIMIALGIGALWTGNAFGPALGIGALLVMALSWFYEAPRFDPGAFGKLWTLLTVGMIAGAMGLAIFSDYLVVEVGVFFVVYLASAKLFQRARLADYLQLLSLSFLLLAAATAFNNDITFGVFFFLYVIVGVVTFAVYHLNVQLEENEKRGGQRVAQLFGLGYAGTLAGLALATFLISVTFFFVFPRLGFGFFVQKHRDGPQTTGFSENVDLGNHGNIKSDERVVMQVVFPDRTTPPDNLRYFRGISFDKYDGQRWSSTLDIRQRQVPNSDWEIELAGTWSKGQTSLPSSELEEQRIYLEPIGAKVLFGLSRVEKIGLSDKDQGIPQIFRRQKISLTETGDIRTETASSIGFQYRAYSSLRRPNPAVLQDVTRADIERKLGPRHAESYVQLPDTISPEIAELTAQVIIGKTTEFDRVVAVEDHLRNTYQYTTDLPDIGDKAPLDAFLFDTRRGHCEFFASAMVVMLRTQGIRARNVNGFRGGKWNDFGDFLAVRNADAHSWVEVHFAEHGWVTFDPTPAASDVSYQSNWYDAASQLYETVKFNWYKYVVEYDLETQIDFLRKAAVSMGATPEQAKPGNFSWRLREIFLGARKNILPALMVLLLSLGTGLWVRLRVGPKWVDGAAAGASSGAGLLIVVLMWKPEAYLAVELTSMGLPAGMVALASYARTRKQKRRVRVRHDEVSKVYLELRDTYQNHGLIMRATAGPSAFRKQVAESAMPGQAQAVRIIDRYLQVRFGGAEADHSELRAMRKMVRSISKSLAKQKHGKDRP